MYCYGEPVNGEMSTETIHVQYTQAESGCLLPILEVVTLINVAKCNLGKAKIQPMLVAGLCLTGVYGSPLKRM